ncbi:HAD-superfamily hydrolase [Trichocladium antarcticum]|uniref:HAD-superfamily hydrolase n=1 Tax=Trichocladium antarcticum TaxID=1450529 RepID=A0AAN6UEA9_9PEZI|nr:HAD-superfamily hydrolase [Trichocladium antarcticum]
MSKSGFKDVEFDKSKPEAQRPLGSVNTPPDSPKRKHRPMELPLHKASDHGSIGHRRRTSWGELEGSLTIPVSPGSHNTIEVPSLRSPDADSTQFMHNLSATPSMRERRVSRNSFGASLPIPKSKRQSRLSSVVYPEGEGAKAGLPMSATRDILTAQAQDVHSEKVQAAKNMAFVFDIDGVLVHGDRLIPQGKATLDMLNGDNQLGIKIPHIFLTNGSGKPELARVEQLSKILHNPISTDQFIQSHTPMRALAEYYSTVLVVGGEGYRCREVAEEYGFKDIVVPNDIVAWDPTIAPYRVFTDAERATSRPRDFTKMNIEAILVFSDSRDYATDMQIIMDLLRSERGRLGTTAADPVSQRIPIYFSQGDLLCPTEHPTPRMSQGAFRIGLEAMYKALTGEELERVVYGKPELATYKYADEVIASWMDELHGEERVPANVYMIGDNPASDIIGGNMYGWNTCLVRTGVFQGGDNDEENPANFGVFTNVWDAVTAACRKELGDDFGFKWDARKMNPVLHDSHAASAVEV